MGASTMRPEDQTMNTLHRRMNTRIGRQPLMWVVLLLLLLNLLFAGLSGCQSARDSGSAVTGRILSVPSQGGISFLRVLLDGTNADRFQVTDSSGSFAMYHVPVGTYKVTWAGFGVNVYKQDLVVDQNDQTYVVDVPAMQPGSGALSGKITDPDGKIAGADIWVVFSGKGIAHAVTSDSGMYGFTGLPDAEATIIAKAPGHETKTLSGVRIGFEGISRLDIELTPAAAIQMGTVKGTISNEDGKVLGDAYVGAFPAGVVLSIYSIATEEMLSTAQGYSLDLPPGSYTIVCTKSGYAPKWRHLTVAAGLEYTLDFSLISEETIWREGNTAGPILPIKGE